MSTNVATAMLERWIENGRFDEQIARWMDRIRFENYPFYVAWADGSRFASAGVRGELS